MPDTGTGVQSAEPPPRRLERKNLARFSPFRKWAPLRLRGFARDKLRTSMPRPTLENGSHAKPQSRKESAHARLDAWPGKPQPAIAPSDRLRDAPGANVRFERHSAGFTSGPYYRRAATAFIHSSMDDRDSLSRLTEREKVCLRQWLNHMSAKEIAAHLGISHHAVEKRLKMARTKLGATSSLEAARILGEAEGYGQAVAQSPDLVSGALPLHSGFIRSAVFGVAIMILVGAIVLGLLLQPATFSQAANNQPVAPPRERVSAPASVPSAGTEAALRRLVAGLASGSPDYDKLSPRFAEVVRRDLPRTHPLFSAMGELKSVTFRGRGEIGDDVYDLVFANGGVIMSAALDADGRMVGGILQPVGRPGEPAAGTEAALRSLVAGLASGSPDYDKLSPQFAEIVRRDLPMTHRMFSALGELKSVTFRGRGERGDDAYDLVFANGEVTMSAALDSDGRMAGGFLRPVGAPGH